MVPLNGPGSSNSYCGSFPKQYHLNQQNNSDTSDDDSSRAEQEARVAEAGQKKSFLTFSLFGNGRMEQVLGQTSVSPAACGSASVTPPTPGEEPLQAPKNLLPENGYRTRDTSLTLSWGAVEGEAITYNLYLKRPTDGDLSLLASTTETTFDLSDLGVGIHKWRVDASDGTNVAASPVVSFEVFYNGLPVRPTLTNPENNAVEVPLDVLFTWSESIDFDGDEVTYDLYFWEQGGTGWRDPVAVGLTENSYQAVTLKGGTTYEWKVVVNDGYGSIPSETFMFTTVYYPPAAPAYLYPGDDFTTTDRSVSLGWDEVEGDDILYNVYLKGPGDESFVFQGDTEGITFDLDNLTPGEYEWYVQSHDGISGSEVLETRDFTVVNNPPELEMTYPGAGAEDIPLDITFTWRGEDADGDELTYKIYIKAAGEEWGDPIAEGL
ncbi:hypothetical protein ACFL31_04860, partial [Candidatus Margulisiibacteriota bacterium]